MSNDTDAIKSRIEQALHAATCLHADCIRCIEDIPFPAELAALLANDAASLLLRVYELENSKRR